MKRQYKIQLPKGKKVTMPNVDFENGVMTVNVELENDFHKAMHDEVCDVFGKINNQWQDLPNGYERYKGAMLRHLCQVEKGNDIDNELQPPARLPPRGQKVLKGSEHKI